MHIDTEKLRDHFRKKLDELEKQKSGIEKKLDLVGELEQVAREMPEESAPADKKLEDALLEIFEPHLHALPVSDVVRRLEPYGYSEEDYDEVKETLNRLYHRGRLDKTHDASGQDSFKRVPQPPQV